MAMGVGCCCEGSTAEGVITACSFPGSNAGEKIQAAIDSLTPVGGVIDARCLEGAQEIDSTVTIDKPCQILLGASDFNSTAAPVFHFLHGADPEPGPGSGGGSELVGAGISTTKFFLDAGITGILIQGDFVKVSGMLLKFGGDDAANIGIDCRWETPTTPHGLLRPFIDQVFLIGGGTLGKGINFSVVFGGDVARSQIYGFQDGVVFHDDGNDSCTTVTLYNNRIHGNARYGIKIENASTLRFHKNEIEGNGGHSIHIVDGQHITSDTDYFESQGPDNFYVAAAPDNFPRTHFVINPQFFDAPGPLGVHLAPLSTAYQTIMIVGGVGNSGHKAEGAGRIVSDKYQSLNDANVGSVIEIAPRFAIAPTKYRVVGPTAWEYAFQGWSEISVDTTFVWQPTGNASFYFRSFTETNLMVIDGVNNTVAIGAAGTSFGRFEVDSTSVSTAGGTTRINIYSGFDVKPASASASDFAAIFGDGVGDAASENVTGSIHGVVGDTTWLSASKTLSTGRGVRGRVVNSAAGVITEGYALYAKVKNDGAGQITYAAGLLVDAPLNNAGAGGTIPNYYGVVIYKPASYTGFTTTYGIFLDDFSGGTAGIKSLGGLLDWAGNVKIGGNVGFYATNPVAQQTPTGSRGGNAALASLLTALAATGLIIDGTTS